MPRRRPAVLQRGSSGDLNAGSGVWLELCTCISITSWHPSLRPLQNSSQTLCINSSVAWNNRVTSIQQCLALGVLANSRGLGKPCHLGLPKKSSQVNDFLRKFSNLNYFSRLQHPDSGWVERPGLEAELSLHLGDHLSSGLAHALHGQGLRKRFQGLGGAFKVSKVWCSFHDRVVSVQPQLSNTSG